MLEAVAIDVIPLHHPVNLRAVLPRKAGRLRDISVRGRQETRQVFLLEMFFRLRIGRNTGIQAHAVFKRQLLRYGGRLRLQLLKQVMQIQFVVAREDYAPLNGILQFTDISGPIIGR